MGIEQEYVARHPRSGELHIRAAKVLPSGVTHDARHLRPFPIAVERAAGSRKWDLDGHEYVDYVMGHGALLLGHNHPVVTEAARRQLELGTHLGAGHVHEVEWAEEVVQLVPSAEVVRFTSSGTEATLMALRLARAYTGRPAVLKFERHFHGWHDYVAASSKYAGAAPAGVPHSTMESIVVVPPDMDAVRRACDERSDIGAIIVEAAGASSGALPIPEGFLRELRELTAARGVVFIMDEVVTGFRWAPGGVQAIDGVRPDLTALAKILAGGFPGGAVAGKREILDRLAFSPPGERREEKVGHPGTFNANPLSAAAGVACLREVANGDHQRAASEMAQRLRTGMNEVLSSAGTPGYVYGESSAFRIVLGGDAPPEPRDYHARELPIDLLLRGAPAEEGRLLQLALLSRGVHFFGLGGLVSSVHNEADLQLTLEAWNGSLEALKREGVTASPAGSSR
ncbi:MAG TPA: aspartate aminotransferase family protein [Tepidiformaceae bacterium]|nr:aspartate aminotransferase family protein [Tepidiformaceae bacterium]